MHWNLKAIPITCPIVSNTIIDQSEFSFPAPLRCSHWLSRDRFDTSILLARQDKLQSPRRVNSTIRCCQYLRVDKNARMKKLTAAFQHRVPNAVTAELASGDRVETLREWNLWALWSKTLTRCFRQWFIGHGFTTQLLTPSRFVSILAGLPPPVYCRGFINACLEGRHRKLWNI